MTVGAIAGAISCSVIIILLGILLTIFFYDNDIIGGMIATIIIGTILVVGVWTISIWWCKNTESGQRALKTQNSNFHGGIVREVKVYDVEGDIIATYKGKFDIEYDNDRILFDDENGNRHIIYYPTGNVIIDEISE